ncbi:MAG: 23S rRNA (adenine(1618)-N(6))-methyltransferase RlmF [Bacteroidetes bacterium]|nr:MAG: 23S rRNA (adenine(1618)-N(6))-methyltransferase RlmF [Bacteroidota bacterium]
MKKPRALNEREHAKIKSALHPRNKHIERYDFKLLIAGSPELGQFVNLNKYRDESIDFFNPEAVEALNKALLKQYYAIDNWSIPKDYLCPPIPGRADYIHHIADLLYAKVSGQSDKYSELGKRIVCLDIGVGANCIYPILGNREYGWSFIGSESDPVSLKNALQIVKSNPVLDRKIELRLQNNSKKIFSGIIKEDERFDLTVCNPPFHSSASDAAASAMRKLNNLRKKVSAKPVLNFGGQDNELWYNGGEERFVQHMIRESQQFAANVYWFSTLISKQSGLKNAFIELKRAGAMDVQTISMKQGNKVSRILAWTFLSEEAQLKWIETHWK